MTVYDKFGRPVRSVRISVNSSRACNFNCIFCHMEGFKESSNKLMSPREIERIVRILYNYGVEYVKITGGEPLLRRDILEIISRIRNIGVKEISLTTNGTRLYELAYELKRCGLDRINISLHSLKRWKYFLITGVDRLEYTIKAIKRAIDAGLTPVKINVVILRGLNDNELNDYIEFSKELGGKDTNTLQLIELINVNSRFYKAYHVSLNDIELKLKRDSIHLYVRELHNRPVYILKNGVRVELVKPMNNSSFCMGCDRIRITHDGKFKTCLFRNDNLIDFLTPMRKGASDDELSGLFLKAVSLREPFFKPKGFGEAEFCIADHG